jgi:hypothetical protein
MGLIRRARQTDLQVPDPRYTDTQIHRYTDTQIHRYTDTPPTVFRYWRIALSFFVLAGLTGAFFRIAVAQGDVWGFDLGNIRHAHSHTMYFGWVTPVLMALIAHRMEGLGCKRLPGIRYVVGFSFVTALLAYSPFLFFGYGPAMIGASRIPLSVIAAGFNVLAWYGFVWMYIRARSEAPKSIPLRLFDLALFFLVLATLGAWGLPVLQMFDAENHALKAALTHLFLDTFSEGWFVLGVLGLAATETDLEKASARVGIWMAAIGIPFAFALGMAPSLVPPLFTVLAGIGGMMTAIGLLLVGWSLWRGQLHWIWRVALAALATKALAQGAASLSAGTGWISAPPYRILYLHIMLVGFVSIGLVAAARSIFGSGAVTGSRFLVGSVGVFLLSLVPLTPIWPAALKGTWVLAFAAVAALGPVLAIALVAARSRKDYESRRELPDEDTTT